MRLAVFGAARRVGVVREDLVFDACGAYAAFLRDRGDDPSAEESGAVTVPAELGDFVAGGRRVLEAADAAVSHVLARGLVNTPSGEPLSQALDTAKLHPPIAQRTRMFLAGNNYATHAAGAEGAGATTAADLARVREEVRAVGMRGFISFPESCIGTGDPIVYPSRTDMLDFEGEIAVMIGRECKDVKAARAAEQFYGFFLLNDMSARRAVPVADNPRSRFARDKNFDTSKPAGPFLAVGEFSDPQDIRWETRVNGELRQSGHTADMIVSFAEMLEHLSADLTLYPGDIISGGTPSGTGLDSAPLLADGARDPSAFLQVGDVIELSSPVLGTLRNEIQAKPDR